MRIRTSIFVISLFVVSFIMPLCAQEIAFDFDGNSVINDNDLAIFIAWKRFSDSGINASKDSVLSAASKLLSTVTAVLRLPQEAKDNISSESPDVLNDEDIAIFIAFKRFDDSGIAYTFSSVESAANKLLTLTSEVGKLPGTPIGDSSFSTTITGIQTD